MSMNLACCFIHAGYEYKSERATERGSEKKKERKREGDRERVRSERLREKQMETWRVTEKEKHQEMRECDKDHC